MSFDVDSQHSTQIRPCPTMSDYASGPALGGNYTWKDQKFPPLEKMDGKAYMSPEKQGSEKYVIEAEIYWLDQQIRHNPGKAPYWIQEKGLKIAYYAQAYGSAVIDLYLEVAKKVGKGDEQSLKEISVRALESCSRCQGWESSSEGLVLLASVALFIRYSQSVVIQHHSLYSAAAIGELWKWYVCLTIK